MIRLSLMLLLTLSLSLIAACANLDPPERTQELVAEALERYERVGLDQTLAYYNSKESRDGPWYVWMHDSEGQIIARFDQRFVGQSLLDELRADARGNEYGPQMLQATEEGKWVSYLFENPDAGGEIQQKHAWVVRSGDVFFGAGWYEGIE